MPSDAEEPQAAPPGPSSPDPFAPPAAAVPSPPAPLPAAALTAEAAPPRGVWALLRHPTLALAGRVVLGLAALASVVAIYGPFLAQAAKNGADPSYFNDDARIFVFPFDHDSDPELFPNDYLGNYVVACLPTGFRLLYSGFAHFGDPRTLSKVLPLLLLAIVVAALVAAAAKFGRVASAWVAVCLCLSSGLYMNRMCGGLPRAFAFPVIACAAAALVHGRMVALAVITVVGAAFYPAAATPAGMALTGALLFLPARDRGTAATWSLRRRLGTLAATVFAAALVMAPMSLYPRKYGGYLREGDMTAYPEGGDGGRFMTGDHPPYKALVSSITDTVTPTLSGRGPHWTDALEDPVVGSSVRERNREGLIYLITGLTLAGFLRLAARDGAARRLTVLLAAAIVGHGLAKLVAPFFYLPERYVLYTFPILIAVMLPGAAYGLLAGAGRLDRPLFRGLAVLAFGLSTLLLLAGRGDGREGFTVRVNPKAGIYRFIAQLPKNVLVAGWPPEMDSVPYVTHRQAFLTQETHQAFQKGYLDALRVRMRALLEAYFASDERALVALRDDFGVTHLVVDKHHYEKAPDYFRPFNGWIRDIYARNSASFEVPRILKTAGVFEDGSQVILDLTRLPAAAEPPPTAP